MRCLWGRRPGALFVDPALSLGVMISMGQAPVGTWNHTTLQATLG